MTEEELVTVVVHETRGDAEIARATLAGSGIEALVVADDEGGLNPGFYRDYGVRVVVRHSDADRAATVLGEPS